MLNLMKMEEKKLTLQDSVVEAGEEDEEEAEDAVGEGARPVNTSREIMIMMAIEIIMMATEAVAEVEVEEEVDVEEVTLVIEATLVEATLEVAVVEVVVVGVAIMTVIKKSQNIHLNHKYRNVHSLSKLKKTLNSLLKA